MGQLVRHIEEGVVTELKSSRATGRYVRERKEQVLACRDPTAETFLAPRKVTGLWPVDWLDPVFRMMFGKLLKSKLISMPDPSSLEAARGWTA